MARNAEDQARLCHALYEALSLFMKIVLSKDSGEEMSKVMLNANMVSNDREPLYDPLGKTGSAKIETSDVSPQIYHGRTVMKETSEAEKIRRIINSILVIAAEILKAKPLG